MPDTEQAGGGRPGFAAVQMLGAKDLATLAPVFDTDGDALAAKMVAAGYKGATPTSTVIDLAGAEPGRLMAPLRLWASRPDTDEKAPPAWGPFSVSNVRKWRVICGGYQWDVSPDCTART